MFTMDKPTNYMDYVPAMDPSQCSEPVGIFTSFFQKAVSRGFEFANCENAIGNPSPVIDLGTWDLDLGHDELRDLDSFDLEGLLATNNQVSLPEYMNHKTVQQISNAVQREPLTGFDKRVDGYFLTEPQTGRTEFTQIHSGPLLHNLPSEPSSSLHTLLVNPVPYANNTRVQREPDQGRIRKTNKDSKSSKSQQSKRRASNGTESVGRKPRHFWQYNIQAKGPKREVPFHKPSSPDAEPKDPHVLNKPVDPVFQSNVIKDTDWNGVRVKHTGKARRGDGNDLTPNIKKLSNIGRELDTINKAIEALGGDGDNSSVKRSARREKNKLASRGCRLKKKAQHEANKIKLRGLEEQHRELLTTLKLIRSSLINRCSSMLLSAPRSPGMENIAEAVDKLKTTKLRTFVYGRSEDYVNDELRRFTESHRIADSEYQHRMHY